jgi:hypothetical protein
MTTRTIKFVCEAIRWFDRANGNTYHASRITRVRDGAQITVPLTYGYGNHYQHTALEAMAKARWLPTKYRELPGAEHNQFLAYERENGYPVMWSVTDGLKRDAVALVGGR